jgi:hypothetical protein
MGCCRGSLGDVVYLGWPIALSYMNPNAGACGVSANVYSCAHGAQITFGDLTPYLTYGWLVPVDLLLTLVYTQRKLKLAQLSNIHNCTPSPTSFLPHLRQLIHRLGRIMMILVSFPGGKLYKSTFSILSLYLQNDSLHNFQLFSPYFDCFFLRTV